MPDAALSIANLKARYCAAADQCAHDPTGGRAVFADLFTADVVADYGYGSLNGTPAIAAFLATAIAGESEWMVHMLGSPIIAVNGRDATGDWTIKVLSKRRDGTAMAVIGRYSDGFRLTADGWRISKVAFRQCK